MKLTTANPFDFRVVFIPMFLLVTGFGASVNNNFHLKSSGEYFLMVALFVLSLVVGSWGIGPLCNRLLRSTPLNITTTSIVKARALFLIVQFYYGYILYNVIMIFLGSGFSAFETLRTDIKEHISSYIYIPAQFIAIFCICHEIFYRNQRRFVFKNKANYSDGVVFAPQIKKCLRRKDYAVFMIFIYFIESLPLASRSIVFMAAIAFGICWFRGFGKRISIIRSLVFASIFIFLFGFISFYRLFSNPETFNWWVDQGFFESFELQEIGLANAAITMLGFTLGDMVYRPITVVEHIINNSLDYMYGGVSFFFLYSMLPGQQIDPARTLNYNVFHGGTDAGTPATLVSQLFWDFGWCGAIFGGLVVGLIGRGLIRMSLTNLGTIFTLLYAIFLVQLILGIYGTFNVGLLIFYMLLGIPLSIWVNGRSIKRRVCWGQHT
jgi:hypothetical protein